LPSAAALSGAKLNPDRIAKLSPDDMLKLTATLGGEMPLRSIMVWDDKMPGWRTDWTLVENAHEHRWHIDSASFDDAFRGGIQHSAAILAGLSQ
jgi:hypothetical protein